MISNSSKLSKPTLFFGGGSNSVSEEGSTPLYMGKSPPVFGGGSDTVSIRKSYPLSGGGSTSSKKDSEEDTPKNDLHIGYDIGLQEGLKKGIVDTINKILKSFFYDNEIEGNVHTSSKEDGYETIITSVPFVDISPSSIFKIYTSVIIDDEYNLKYKVTIYFFMKDDSLFEKISEITELNIHNLLTYLSEQINFYIQ
jgi:hypothetical protein